MQVKSSVQPVCNDMAISVTIVTKNRAEQLAKGLKSLVDQRFPQKDFEVIVADNGSSDHSRAVIENYATKFENFRCIFDPRPGQLVGWHRALSVARGEINCFIDDDVRPQPTWLAALAEIYRDESVGMATGPIELTFDSDPPEWLNHMKLGGTVAQTLPYLGMLDCGREICEIPGNFVWGTNFSVRRPLLEEAGGFHPCAMPRDLLHYYGDGEIHVGRYVSARGHKILYHPEAKVLHDIPSSRLTFEAVALKFETTAYSRSFQTLRKMRKAYPDPTDLEIVSISNRYFRDPLVAPTELKEAVVKGLARGFRRQLEYFKSDKYFRKWVLRENYLDIDSCYEDPTLMDYVAANQIETDWRRDN